MSQNSCIGSRGRRTGLTLSLGAIVLAGLASCKPYKPEADLRWEETVTLSSGESVRIRRHAVFRQELSWGAGAGAPTFTTSSIEVIEPDSDFVTWDVPLIPFLLDRDAVTREWIVVGNANNSSFYNMNGTPCPPVWFFRLREGVWRLEVLPQELLGRTPNMLADLAPTSEWEFDAEEFARQVESRKAQQLSPAALRLPNSMRKIGGPNPNFPECAPDRAPELSEPRGELRKFWRP